MQLLLDDLEGARASFQAGCPTVIVRKGLKPGGIAPRETVTRFTWSLRP